jgi:hypothetical protein
MLDRFNGIIGAFLLGALASFYGWQMWSSAERAHHPAYYGRHKRTEQKQAQISPLEDANDRIADYTGWLALLTGGLVVVSFIQIRYLIRADRNAVRSADAAMLAIGSDRAWMTFDDLSITGATDSSLNGVPFKNAVVFGVRWRNRGRSPALKCECIIDMRIIPATENIAPPFVPHWGADRNTTPIGPDAFARSQPSFVIDAQIDEFHRWNTVVIVYSAIRYRDVFNTTIERFSEMCVKVRYGGQQKVNDGPLIPRYEITAFGPQNTAE